MTTSYSSIISFNSHTLYIKSLDVRKVQSTKKQVLGKNIIRIAIPGLDSWEYEISINGIMFDDGTNNEVTQRDNLISDQDGSSHGYVDGKHDGNFYITSLEFNDVEGNPNHYVYNLTLIQA